MQEEYPKVVMVSSSDKRDSHPGPVAESGLESFPPSGPQTSGTYRRLFALGTHFLMLLAPNLCTLQLLALIPHGLTHNHT